MRVTVPLDGLDEVATGTGPDEVAVGTGPENVIGVTRKKERNKVRNDSNIASSS